MRTYGNPLNLSVFVLTLRLSDLDPTVNITISSTTIPYKSGEKLIVINCMNIDSTLTDKQITAALSTAQTAAETATKKIKADAKSEAAQAKNLWSLSISEAETRGI
jgi:hypothetical protein